MYESRDTNSKTVVVDSSCICHIAKNVFKGLTFSVKDEEALRAQGLSEDIIDEAKAGHPLPTEIGTGVIFGFLRQLIDLAVRFKTNKFAFAWDSRKSLRLECRPGYKSTRREVEKTDEEKMMDRMAFEQFTSIRSSILPSLGFYNNFIQTGYEADDIIASILMNNEFPSGVIVVSSDHDLYQLLDLCSLYEPKKKEVLTKEDFVNQFGIEPKKWVDVLSIAGCNTDDVKGVPRVGKKTAIKFLRSELAPSTKAYKAIVSPSGQYTKHTNRPLVELPYKDIVPCVLSDNEHFKLSAFRFTFEKYGIQSFLKPETFKVWREQFNLVV